MQFAPLGGPRFKIDLRATFHDQAERVARERGLGFGAERDRDLRRRSGSFPYKEVKTERRRSRTDRAWGCHAAPVLKT
jgi:hypothetical protein